MSTGRHLHRRRCRSGLRLLHFSFARSGRLAGTYVKQAQIIGALCTISPLPLNCCCASASALASFGVASASKPLKALINVSVAWAFFLAWVLYPPGIFGRFFVAAFVLPFLGLGEGLAFFFAGGGLAGSFVLRLRLPARVPPMACTNNVDFVFEASMFSKPHVSKKDLLTVPKHRRELASFVRKLSAQTVFFKRVCIRR